MEPSTALISSTTGIRLREAASFSVKVVCASDAGTWSGWRSAQNMM
jgi:hypothetical protein